MRLPNDAQTQLIECVGSRKQSDSAEVEELESKQLHQYDGSKFYFQPKPPRGPRTPKVGANEVGQANYTTKYVLPLESPVDAQTGPGSAAQPTIIADFAKLNDGTSLELVEDSNDPKRTVTDRESDGEFALPYRRVELRPIRAKSCRPIICQCPCPRSPVGAVPR